MNLVETVAAELRRLTPDGATCLLAVSGGPDSIALLDLLSRGASLHGRPLVVAHVDHGIDPASATPQAIACDAAAARGLRFVCRACGLGPGASETRARVARRRALRQMAQEVSATAIVLAHHADDQAETVLLRLLRGSGPAGLAAMAARRGPWVRPLLALRRHELAEYAGSRGLAVWQDPANEDPRHLRSWLRHQLMPTIADRLPEVVGSLLGAQRQARAARVASDVMPSLVEALDMREVGGVISVAAPPLRGYRSPVRDALLAAIGRRIGATLGGRRRAAIRTLLFSARGVGRIRVTRAVVAELAFDRLTFHQAVPRSFPPARLGDGFPVRAGRRSLTVHRAAVLDAVERSSWTTALAPGEYLVRPWAPGDRIRPVGGTGSRAVATLLREARVAPRDRDDWPVVLLDVDATIVWVPGICRSETMIPQRGAEGLHVHCADT